MGEKYPNTNTRNQKAFCSLPSAFWLLVLITPSAVRAQIVPDNTLPVNSQVTGCPVCLIEGGTVRGVNLFHSFEEFSVQTGGEAFFNNGLDIENILGRVTGTNISDIDGWIRANGTVNLFLINPNGIVFGENARLDVGGSLVASTANSINFADNFQYSATNPTTAPLLTFSVPVGLQMGANPGQIVVQGNGYDLSIQVPIFSPIIRGTSSTGLRVSPGKTLALVGGDIDIVGGTLTADQGRIELGSIRDGQVKLNAISSSFELNYQGVQSFQDIRLSQQALADTSGGGAIQVQGNQVSLADGSIILIQNQGTQQGGSISVNAAQSLEASGTSPDGTIYGGLRSETAGSRGGANIAVSTKQLVLESGAVISTTSYGSGKAGNATVNASDSVQVIGFSPLNPSLGSGISSGVFRSSGDGGVVTVSARRVTILNGGNIASVNFGTGQGGDVTVNATESVEMAGVVPGLLVPSTVATTSFNAGNAGKVIINTSRLLLRDGGAVSSNTLATGNAGALTINARESVEISGKVPGSPLPSAVRSSAPIVPYSLQQVYGLAPVPSGASGDVTINTGRLSVTDGAKVDVSNQGVGKAGILQVNANSVFLDTQGSITAATASGEGGNIELNVPDVLLLRNNSPITASAGGTGNGGNITIDSLFIVATSPTGKNGSDITANAGQGNGGAIGITTQGLFGIEFRPQLTPQNDITVSSQFGLSGTYELNSPNIDPSRGLLNLPNQFVDVSRQMRQNCPARGTGQENRFVVTGTGGLPPRPGDSIDSPFPTGEVRSLPSSSANHAPGKAAENVEQTQRTQIIEATGWVRNEKGEVILVASDPTTPQNGSTSATCTDAVGTR